MSAPRATSPHLRRPLPPSARAALICAALAGAVALWASPADAAHARPEDAPKRSFEARAVQSGFVKVDGFITDWNDVQKHECKALVSGEPEYDWTGPLDLSLLLQFQYDDANLYIAVEVRDNIVSPPRGRDRGDRVEIWFDSGPTSASKVGRLRMLELALGELPSDGPPEVTWQHPRALAGKIPEGLKKDGSLRNTGYFFEIAIPLAEISDPAPGLEPIGIVAFARDWDRDDPNEDEAAVATAPFDAKKASNYEAMGSLSLSGAAAMGDSFFRKVPDARLLKVQETLWANVGGDGRRERVQLVDKYLVMTGFGLGFGDFYYYTMAHSPQHTFKKLETRELTGDGHDEMLVWYTIGKPEHVEQTMLAIYHFDQDRIKLIFHHEIGNRGEDWEVEDEVAFTPMGKDKPTNILVSRPAKAQGVDADTYVDTDGDMIVDWERILLPWGAVKVNTFEWSAGQFIRVTD